MIIRRDDDRLLFIRQPDHATLAGEIMSRWRLGGLPDHPRRAAILSATRDHDTGWIEEDASPPVSAQGEPLDFVAVDLSVKQRTWPRATARLAPASPYVAALVAQHALTIYESQRGQPAWQHFFDTMGGIRDALLRDAKQHADDLAADYRFVRTGDLLSLTFCNGWSAPLAGIGYDAILRGITLEITPDPFAGVRIPLSVPARALPIRSYQSETELREALERAPVVLVEGDAIGVPPPR